MARFLLLHAFPLDGSMWDGVAEALRADGHVVLAPDLPGFGSARLPSDRPDIVTMAGQVLTQLGESPACIVGCSMGGYVAFAVARRRPDLVAALGLVDTKATADGVAARTHREHVAALAESGGDWSAGMIEGLLGETTRSTRPDTVAHVQRALVHASPAGVSWAQRAMAARPDAQDVLSALTVPVLVVWGEEDTLSPWSEQQIMIDAASHATVVRIPGAGHLSPVESPTAVAGALRELVARP